MSDISNEYAKALFMLAKEKECVDEYKSALMTVSDAFEENPMYIEFLCSYSIPLDERLDALESAFGNAISRDVLSFLKILCEKKHILEFSECANHFYAMNDEINNISKAKVISAIELTEDEKILIKEKLEKTSGHKIIVDYVIDDSLLGGLIVEMDGKTMDVSLKKHLKDVKDVMSR